MSQSSKVLRKLSSSEVAKQNREYVDKRRKGLITSLKTKYSKLNSSLMGGLEWDTIMCISALSGAGKSTLSKTIRDSMVTLNTNQKFKQYIFNFEMLAHQQIGRSIVSDADIDMRNLYSVDEPLTDEQFKALDIYYKQLAERDVSFIEVPNTPEVIVNSLLHYWETECKDTDHTIVYEIDHALLVKGRTGQSEKERIDELMYLLVDAKKYIASKGGHSVGIVLSQMNREIKDVTRRHSPDLHRPDTSCLFGASSIEQCSDYILFSHIPARLGISCYTENRLPTRMSVEGKILQIPYFELVKQRSGASDLTIPLWNRLNRFDFDEMDKDVFDRLRKDFIDSDCQKIPQIEAQSKLF